MAKKAQEAKSCIFCNGTGLTKQHVWPDWLRNFIERKDNDFHTQRVTRNVFEKGTIAKVSDEIKPKQGYMGSRKIRNVCSKCNNGWMSLLEQKVKPIISPMIKGTPLILTPGDQHTIATWAVMTMIMAEYTDVNTISIPASHRYHLLQYGTPPMDWKIWIGKYEGTEWNFRYRHRSCYVGTYDEGMAHINGIKPVSGNIQLSTMVIDKLLFHCVSAPQEILEHCNWAREREIGLTQIWPIPESMHMGKRNADWIGGTVINDFIAMLISDYFYVKIGTVKTLIINNKPESVCHKFNILDI